MWTWVIITHGLLAQIPWYWSKADVGFLCPVKEHWGLCEAVTLSTLCSHPLALALGAMYSSFQLTVPTVHFLPSASPGRASGP